MNKKKIAFLIPALKAGGAERVLTTLANEFVKDYEIIILTFDNHKPFYKLCDEIRIHPCSNLPYIAPSKNLFESVILNFKLFSEIIKISKKEKVDIFISFLTIANVLGILASKYRKIPIIVSERNNPNKEIISKFWNFLRKITYPKANFVVVQTSIIADYFREIINKKQLKILPNPISHDLNISSNSKLERQNIILNVGRLCEQKGQDTLIKAFAILKEKNWKLLIAGDGEKKNELQILIKKLDLTEKVFLVGRIKDVSKLYQEASIFAFSSNFEGFPNALLEAMYFGLPCVSTDCPTGPSELIKNNVNGYLVPMKDEFEMAKKLSVLISDENKRKKFGVEASKTVLKFNSSTVSNQWINLIRETS